MKGHVSLKTIHATQNIHLANNNRFSINFVDPWIFSKVIESIISKISDIQRVWNWGSNLVYGLSPLLISMSHHGYYHWIHHHVRWNLQEHFTLTNYIDFKIINIKNFHEMFTVNLHKVRTNSDSNKTKPYAFPIDFFSI